MSKIEINVLDFITEEHKQEIRENLLKAIKKIDYAKIVKEIERELIENQVPYLTDYVFEDINTEEIQKLVSGTILKLLQEKFK